MGQGRDRNVQCHCGSGKKYKNCCMEKDRAPRMRGFSFEPKTDGLITGVSIGPHGEIVLMDGNKAVEVQNAKATEWRQTAKGLKASSQVDLHNGTNFFDPEHMLMTQDFVFGVDTNQIRVEGQIINISSLTCASGMIPEGPYSGSIQQLLGLDFVDTEQVAERIGWLFGIRTIINSGISRNHRITLCVDHDMMSHSAINKREQPIVRDFYLPENFTLMYARDRGSAVQNKCVSVADTGASHIGKRFVEQRPATQFVLDELMLDGDRGRLRYWYSDAYHKHFKP